MKVIAAMPAELLEARRLLTTAFEQVASFDAVWVSVHQRVIDHKFSPNESYKVEVEMSDGPLAPNSDPPNYGSLTIYENGTKAKKLEGYGNLNTSYEGRFSSTGGKLSFHWQLSDGVHINDPDLKLSVRVYATKKVNLTVGDIQISNTGSIRYSAKIDGKSGASLDREAKVQVFYAKGPNENDILREVDPAQTIGTKPGSWRYYEVSPDKILQSPPPETTHLVAVVDRDNKAVETDESWTDNSSALRLPNIRLDSLQLVQLEDPRDHEITLKYTVENGSRQIGVKPDIEFWFLNAEGKPRKKIDSPFVDMTGSGQSSFTIPHQLLSEVPAGAVSVGALVDPAHKLLETDTSDNFSEVDLPGRLINTRLRVTDMRWLKSGEHEDGVEIEYYLQKGQMPSDVSPVAKFYWSDSPVVPEGATPAHQQALSWEQRDGVLVVSPGVIGRTWSNQAFLIAVVEMPDDVPRDEYRAWRKHISTAAVDGNVAPALGNFSPAPARIKVASWIAQNQRTITRTAKTFRISPEALASAIAYEALTDTTNTSALVDLFSYDAMAVEGTAIFKRGFITPKSEDVRDQPISASETIQYVAGIMRGYSLEAKRQGFEINKDVAQLVSLFSNRLRRGSSDVPESLYTGISPSLLPQGGAFSAANHSLGTPLFTQPINAANDSVEVYSWNQRPFDRRQQTFVLTHGFQSSPAAWSVGVAQALRQRFPDSNILLVDW
ncbi:MAG: hypothetical protein KDA89_09880, partial [Planctomycetaceae bacterium]|nr:hypothetical protein [Planctomycetaceae bacterium]